MQKSVPMQKPVPMQKIVPFLWFDSNAEEAANFYTGIFKDAAITHIGRAEGKVFSVSFRLEGQEFYALNGGPHYQFTPAISLFINCETQAEVDDLWERLSAGGEKNRCGWLTDKFGVTWQVVPTILGKILTDPNPQKAQASMQAMMTMDKLDIAALQHAYDNA